MVSTVYSAKAAFKLLADRLELNSICFSEAGSELKLFLNTSFIKFKWLYVGIRIYKCIK